MVSIQKIFFGKTSNYFVFSWTVCYWEGEIRKQVEIRYRVFWQYPLINYLYHETATAAGLVNIDDSEIVIQYVDVPTDIQPIVEVSCGTSKLICGFFPCFCPFFYFPMLFYSSFNPTMFVLGLLVSKCLRLNIGGLKLF